MQKVIRNVLFRGIVLFLCIMIYIKQKNAFSTIWPTYTIIHVTHFKKMSYKNGKNSMCSDKKHALEATISIGPITKYTFSESTDTWALYNITDNIKNK